MAETMTTTTGGNGKSTSGNLLDVQHLKMYFPVTRGIVFERKIADVKAVDDVSFYIKSGGTLGLVGESGCGKTTTGRAIVQLYRPTAGTVTFHDDETGQDVELT